MTDLVAWYKASSLGLSNGATVTSWPDDSPNNNDLDTYESAPIYNASDALLNGMPSVTYDGNDSNYRSNPTGLPVGSSACTTYVVGYWSGAANGDMFTWGSNAYNGARMGAGYYSGMVFENGGIATAQRAVSANTPFIFSYPYVAGANTTAAMTYLNGVVATGEYPGLSGVANISNPVAEIVIGRPATAPVERWTGAVAEVLVFNTTHSATTRAGIEKYLANKYGISITSITIPGGFKIKVASGVSATPIVSSGLILYLDASNPTSYPGSGTTWYDLSGLGNHTAAMGTPTYTATNGGGFTFTFGSDYFDTTPNLRESYTATGLSVAAWAKATSLPYVSAIASREDWNSSSGWALHEHFNNTLMGPRYQNAQSAQNAVLTNTIYFLAFTIDTSGNAKVFVNGVQSGATSTGVTLPTSATNSPQIGRFAANISYPWIGDIYEVHMYNRNLSDAEVLQNFNGTKARFGL
jgi:hypothetical protein